MEMRPVVKKNLSDSVTSQLREYIFSMDEGQSTKLPPENIISQNYGVSRVTVRRALDELEQEGLILRIHGRGTFVNPKATQLKVNLLTAWELGRLLQHSGYAVRTELTRLVKSNADLNLAENLELAPTSPLLLIEKNYYADEHLAITCIDYVPQHHFSQLPPEEEWATQSTHDILRAYAGILLARERIQLRATFPEDMKRYSPQADRYHCGAMLELSGPSYSTDNVPIFYGRTFYDTKYVQFHLMRTQMVY